MNKLKTHLLLAAILAAGMALLANPLSVNNVLWTSDMKLDIRLENVSDGPLETAICDTMAIEPAMDFRIERIGNDIYVEADFQPGSYYSVILKPGFPNPNGRDSLTEEKVFHFMSPNLPSDTQWYSQGIFLPVDAPAWELPIWEVNSTEHPSTVRLSRLYRSSLLHFISSTKVWNGETTRDMGQMIIPPQRALNKRQLLSVPLEQLGVERKPGIYALSIDHGQTEKGIFPHERRLVVTDLGIFLYQNGTNYHAFVYSLKDPKTPIPGISVYLYSEKQQLICDDITDGRGYVRMVLPAQWDKEDAPHYLLAVNEETKDTAWITLRHADAINLMDTDVSPRAVPGIIYSDRGVYQRGTTVTLTGLVRNGEGKPLANSEAEIVVVAPDGTEIFQKVGTLDEYGFMQSSFVLPEDAPLGFYHADLRPPRATNGHAVCHASTNFEVLYITYATVNSTLEASQDGPGKWVYHGKFVDKQGHAIGAAQVDTTISFDWSHFSPPEKYSEYSFQVPPKTCRVPMVHHQGQTNYEGIFSGEVAIPVGTNWNTIPVAPLDIHIHSEIAEVGSEGIFVTLDRTCQHHVFDHYTGVRVDCSADGTCRSQLCAIRPDGEEISLNETQLDYRLTGVQWEYLLQETSENLLKRVWQEVEKDISTGPIELDEQQCFPLAVPSPGSYRLLIKDRATGQSLCFTEFSYGEGVICGRTAIPTELVFHLDRESYSPGEEAQLSFECPFDGIAHYLVGAPGIAVAKFFQEVKRGKNTIPVKIPSEGIGGACQVPIHIVGANGEGRSCQDVPCLQGNAVIPVNQDNHRVKVIFDCPSVVMPGESMEVRIGLQDENGRPVPGRVALWGVDEDILELSDYRLPDPYRKIFGDVTSAFILRSNYEQLYPKIHIDAEGHVGGDSPGTAEDTALRRQRLLSEYLRGFRGEKTVARSTQLGFVDVSGKENDFASVHFRVPTSECDFRLMAVASGMEGVGGDTVLIQVEDVVEAKIEAPSAMIPGDEGVFRVTFTNRYSKADFFPCHISILSPEYQQKIPFSYDDFLNIPQGESECVEQVLKLPKDLPEGELLVRVTWDMAKEKHTVDHKIIVRQPRHLQRTVSFLYAYPGDVTPSFTLDGSKMNHAKVGGFELALQEHLNWMNQTSYEKLEQKLSKIFICLHLQALEKKGLVHIDEEEHMAGAIVDQLMAELPFFRLGNGYYSPYLNGKETWLYGTMLTFCVECMADRFFEHPMTEERYREIRQALLSVLEDPRSALEAQAFGCWCLAVLGDPLAFPYTKCLYENFPNSSHFVKLVCAMSMFQAGYPEEGENIQRKLTWPSLLGELDPTMENTFLCMASAAFWLYSVEMPGDTKLVPFFRLLTNQVSNMRNEPVYRLHGWMAVAISRYLMLYGDHFQKGDMAGKVFHQGEGKKAYNAKGGAFPLALTEAGVYHVRNTGKVPLVVVLTKEAEIADSVHAENLHFTQEFLNAAGEKIDSCKVGDLVTLRLWYDGPSFEDATLNYQLPGGFVVDDELIPGAYVGEIQLNIPIDAVGVVPRYIEKRPNQLLWFGNLNMDGVTDDSQRTFEFHVRAMCPGKYQVPPTIMSVTFMQEVQKIISGNTAVFTIEP